MPALRSSRCTKTKGRKARLPRCHTLQMRTEALNQPARPSSASAPTSRQSPTDSSNSSRSGSIESSSPESSVGVFASPGVSGGQKLRIDQQMLWNHWCAFTEKHLTHPRNKGTLWQLFIRHKSRNHPALHSSILVFSAMHLAIGRPGSIEREGLLCAAERHYYEAVQSLSIQDSSDSPCNGDFSAVSLLAMCGLACPLLAGEGLDLSIDRLLQIFTFVRELPCSSNVMSGIKEGELKHLFDGKAYPQLPNTYKLTINSMRNLNRRLIETDPARETDVYDDSITELDRALGMLSQGGEPTIIILQWIFCLSPRYLDLLQGRDPLALIILAHSSAILHRLRDRWWARGWGRQVVLEISEVLGPDRVFILWALDLVGVPEI